MFGCDEHELNNTDLYISNDIQMSREILAQFDEIHLYITEMKNDLLHTMKTQIFIDGIPESPADKMDK